MSWSPDNRFVIGVVHAPLDSPIVANGWTDLAIGSLISGDLIKTYGSDSNVEFTLFGLRLP